MPTKAELEVKIEQLEMTNKVLLRQGQDAMAALKVYQDIEKRTGLDIWEAENENSGRTPCICVGLNNGFSVNIYPADGPAQGLAVFDADKLVFVAGLIPASLVMEEVAYARNHE